MLKNKNKERRLKLWNEDPRCRNCGVVTVLEGHNIDNKATIQHIYDRFHYLRAKSKVTLFCHKCNDLDNRNRIKYHPKAVISYKGFLATMGKDKTYSISYRGVKIGYIGLDTIFINTDESRHIFQFIELCKTELSKIQK